MLMKEKNVQMTAEKDRETEVTGEIVKGEDHLLPETEIDEIDTREPTAETNDKCRYALEQK